MKIIAVFLCVVAVSGCSTIRPSVESSTPRSVVIEGGVQYATDATTLAQAECQKHGRHARLRSDKQDIIGWVWTYDCVE